MEVRVRRSTTYIIGIAERENKETEFEKILSEKFPKLMKNISLPIQKVQ